MRVVLVHNPSAGEENHSAEELEDQIRAAGHSLVASISSPDELRKERSCDLVVVAGGDGTVGQVADALAGDQIAMTIIPVGTANNIARSLGLMRHAGKLIERWSSASVVTFDAGHVMLGGKPRRRFFEGFGFGAFPRVMHGADSSAHQPEVTDETLDRDRIIARDVLRHAPIEEYEVVLDGCDLSGRYFMVEVMNIRYLGPHIDLAPDAHPADGEFDVVLLGDEHREALIGHVKALRRAEGETTPADLPTVRARHIRITPAGGGLAHHDGELAGDERVEIVIEPGAVRFLR